MNPSAVELGNVTSSLAEVTRREFVARAAAGAAALSAAWEMLSAPAVQAAGAPTPSTSVLVNEAFLRKQYPQDIALLLDGVKKFAEQHGGDVVYVGKDTTPVAIKAQLLKLERRPKGLVIFGAEDAIPRFKVKAPGVELAIDYFYGDLDGDGVAEVTISRVLGNPWAMLRQLGMSPPARLLDRITYRGNNGPKAIVGEVHRTGTDQWVETNNAGSLGFRSMSETDSELVLYDASRDIYFKAELTTRRFFTRTGTTQSWRPTYEVVDVETEAVPTRAPAASKAPRALLLSDDPRRHLEINALATVLGDLGCILDVRDWADPRMLAEADVIEMAGHGNPNGWYGGITGTMVTVATVPELPRHPIVFAGACSTATPGAPILRTFMEKGCRVYIGPASDGYGFTPGAIANEVAMHFADALRTHPDWSVATLVAESRNQYIRVNQLGPQLLKLEKGEAPQVDAVAVHTALQGMVFGDITATFPRSQPRPIYAKHVLASDPRTLKAGDSIPVRFEIGPNDGLPTLFFRADWDKDVCASLEIEIRQNGKLLHKLDWREQREFWAYADLRSGGYYDKARYHAFALVPLIRRAGANEATIRLTKASKAIQVRPESALQVWPKRKPVRLPPSRMVRQDGINLLWLCRDTDLDPLRNALTTIDRLQFDKHRDFGDRLAAFEFPEDPNQLLDLARYDVILIDDVSGGYRAFPRGMGAKVRDFVKNGGGLVMTGGEDSFNGKFGVISQGGYGGTPIEEALPVRIISADDCVNKKTTVGPIDARHPIAAGLDWSTFPPILGYNRVAAKPGADVLARTGSGDPFLAVWQYGKGRAAALTTRSNRDWGSEFKKWAYYARFWGNLIRWVSPTRDEAGHD